MLFCDAGEPRSIPGRDMFVLGCSSRGWRWPWSSDSSLSIIRWFLKDCLWPNLIFLTPSFLLQGKAPAAAASGSIRGCHQPRQGPLLPRRSGWYLIPHFCSGYVRLLCYLSPVGNICNLRVFTADNTLCECFRKLDLNSSSPYRSQPQAE